MQVNRASRNAPMPNRMPNRILLTVKTVFQSIGIFSFDVAFA